eukprot:gene6783-7000_t
MPRVWQPPRPTLCISSIAAGASHVLAVTACGGLWGWGGNSSQQLGLDIENGFVAFPLELSVMPQGAAQEASAQVTSAAAGEEHSALLTSQGRVYTAGSNRLGQCGQHPDLQLSSQGQCGPQMVKEPKGCCHHLVDVGPDTSWHGLSRPSAAQVAAAGGSVQRALPKGELYAWGAGSKGQLGTGGSQAVQATPAKLPWAKGITSICASRVGHFATALDSHHKLYTWGAGRSGQLGHGDTNKRSVGRLVKQVRHLDVLQVGWQALTFMLQWMLQVAATFRRLTSVHQ